MKRLQLFEFEDLPGFPSWLRGCMTRYIAQIHKMLGSASNIAQLLDKLLKDGNHHLLDLCTGSGGPMLEVARILKSQYGYQDLKVTLCDLYPDLQTVVRIKQLNDPSLHYEATPVDATKVGSQQAVRTMICSLHHMKPQLAQGILLDAQQSRQPLLVYEISDNSFPKWIWWIAIPFNVIAVWLITPLVRPVTWQQLIFTYLIPILPLVIAWDGAVSNARTYTWQDLDTLLAKLPKANYCWEKGLINGKGGPKLFLIGSPNQV